ncbi:hypothetical protein [Mesorhizobium onobrychidis]|uniref:DUF4331 domain-containing protein n=1 Tax=Mesorhizobium onobrychidis TaxID=2775404 RepID=A0ABY5R8X4_9HYPH|nr:hypothetical protein [Mesorhizobium onobrychidis]UVC19432.1 hypothetical protein IHQ72_35905 [Mesorhizobium onobrychidis]
MRRHLAHFLSGSLFATERRRRSVSAERAGRGIFWKLLALSVISVATGVELSATRASDHADPIELVYPNANVTDLFFFPQGDRMIIVFDVRRALRDPGPYQPDPFEYQINIDYDTPVIFDNEAERARYGGTIPQPEGIVATATIKLRLTDLEKPDDKDPGLLKVNATYEGLKDTDKINVYAGVRDDPFIFPRFFKKNTIAMVISVPMTSFPAGKQDFILWGTASKDGELIDYVGRSLRTQIPRFGFLNPIHPSEHVKALMEQKKFTSRIRDFFFNKREGWSKGIAELIQVTFQIRDYDLVPDVMIYSSRFPAGYPNGRLLNDDVVAKTCATGDCLLMELSFIEVDKNLWPRATANDDEKLISDQWPFLAEKWEDEQPKPQAAASIWPYIIGAVILLAIVFWGVGEIIRRLLIRLWLLLRRKPVAPAAAPA